MTVTGNWNAVRIVAVIFLLIAGVFATGASAQSSLEGSLADLINAGQYQEARDLLARSPHGEPDRLLLEGRILKAQGRFGEAIPLLDQALRLRGDDLAIRRELAHTQYLAQQYRPALFHLRRLERTDPDPQLRNAYGQLRAQIDRERPISFRFNFSIEPSTNITRGTTNVFFDANGRRFTVSSLSRSRSGVGYFAGGDVSFNMPLDGNQRLSFVVGANQTRYSVDNQLGRTRARVGLAYDVTRERYRFSALPFYRYEDREDGDDNDTIGIVLSSEYLITGRNRLIFDGVFEDISYRQLDVRNGLRSNVAIGGRYLASSTMFYSYGVTLERINTGLSHNRYRGYGLFGSVERQLASGMVVTAAARIGMRGFDDLFPFAGVKRQDEFGILSLSLRNSRWNLSGITPTMTCTHEVNRSNLSLYDFNATGCRIGFTRSF
ncbi:MAG: surface lipoprotein assembly modifier [Paracoccaceae bacterium]